MLAKTWKFPQCGQRTVKLNLPFFYGYILKGSIPLIPTLRYGRTLNHLLIQCQRAKRELWNVVTRIRPFCCCCCWNLIEKIPMTNYTLIWGKILVVLVCEGKFSEDPGCLVTRTQQQYISFWWTSNLYYIEIFIAILSGWNIDKNISRDVQWIFEDCWICCKQDGLGVINGHQ